MLCLKGHTHFTNGSGTDSESESELPLKGQRHLSKRIRVKTRESDLKGNYIGISGKTFRRLNIMRIPKWFFWLIYEANLGPKAPKLDHVEYFAGVHSIVAAYKKSGKTAVGFDIKAGAHQDILTDGGFFLALRMAIAVIEEVGAAHFGTVCSTWVWI